MVIVHLPPPLRQTIRLLNDNMYSVTYSRHCYIPDSSALRGYGTKPDCPLCASIWRTLRLVQVYYNIGFSWPHLYVLLYTTMPTDYPKCRINNTWINERAHTWVYTYRNISHSRRQTFHIELQELKYLNSS